MAMVSHQNYDHLLHVDEQNPPGSLVEWDLDPDDHLYWRSLKARHGESMIVLQTDNEWQPNDPDHGKFPACEVLQAGNRRWVAAMYLRRVA